MKMTSARQLDRKNSDSHSLPFPWVTPRTAWQPGLARKSGEKHTNHKKREEQKEMGRKQNHQLSSGEGKEIPVGRL
jgi:hypothetical protein